MTRLRDFFHRYRTTRIYLGSVGWLAYTAFVLQFHPSWLVR